MLKTILIFAIPITMVIISLSLLLYPPQYYTSSRSYHTHASQQDRVHWQKAQKYAGYSWLIIGFLLMFGSYYLMKVLFFDDFTILIIILSLQVLISFLPFLWIEKLLKR